MRNLLKKILKSKYLKIMLSLGIVLSAVPTVISDFTNNDSNGFEHYGLIMVGVIFLIQSIKDFSEIWD